MNNWIKNYTNQLLENLIWGADLSDMQLINKLSKRVRFLLCVIDIFSKYACVVTLKDKKGGTIVNAFQNILKISKRKPYKIWRDKAVNFITDQWINEIMARKKYYKNIFNKKWRKICCCWNIYWNFGKQNF